MERKFPAISIEDLTNNLVKIKSDIIIKIRLDKETYDLLTIMSKTVKEENKLNGIPVFLDETFPSGYMAFEYTDFIKIINRHSGIGYEISKTTLSRIKTINNFFPLIKEENDYI